MSSKGNKKPSRPHDVYLTPRPAVLRAFRWLAELYPAFKPNWFLEPGCGEGVFSSVAREVFSPQHICGVDVRDSISAENRGRFTHLERGEDFLSWDPPAHPFELIATNPPFTHAEGFLRKSLVLLPPEGGLMLFLLRIAFLAGQRRSSLWSGRAALPLARVSVLPQRLSFTEDGRTDSADYAWFLFDTHSLFGPSEVVLDWQVF